MNTPFLDGLDSCDLMTLASAKELGRREAELMELRASYAQICSEAEEARLAGDLVKFNQLKELREDWASLVRKAQAQVEFSYSCASYVANTPRLAKYRAKVLGEPINEQ